MDHHVTVPKEQNRRNVKRLPYDTGRCVIRLCWCDRVWTRHDSGITFLIITSKYKVLLCEAERKDFASSGPFVLRKSQSAHGCAPIRVTFEQIRLMAQCLINTLLSFKRKLFRSTDLCRFKPSSQWAEGSGIIFATI